MYTKEQPHDPELEALKIKMQQANKELAEFYSKMSPEQRERENQIYDSVISYFTNLMRDNNASWKESLNRANGVIDQARKDLEDHGAKNAASICKPVQDPILLKNSLSSPDVEFKKSYTISTGTIPD